MPVDDDYGDARPSPGKLKSLEGADASKRMHDYLVTQQRRKEEFWLRKYGKVLATPPPPRLKGERSTGNLPPISTAGALRAPRQHAGHPPMFAAAGPIDSFPMRNPMPDKRHNASHIPYHPIGPIQLPPITTPPGSNPSKEADHAAHMSLAPTRQHSTSQQQTDMPVSETSMNSLMKEASATSAHSQQHARAPPAYLPPLDKENSVGQVLPSFKGGSVMHVAPHTNVVHANPQSSMPGYTHVGPRVHSHNKGMRDLQLELTVLKAIKAREDVLDRLRVACEKLDSSLGGASPFTLAPSDPMVRLFYRLVGQLRSRTLDAVETLAAWHRRGQTTDHFAYYGTPYMVNIGQDLAFLDKQPFLRSRLQEAPAVNDPFLTQVTPEGIPIEEATTMDLRRGNHRFTSDALRIRMARKVLATYCRRTASPGARGARASAGAPATLAAPLDNDNSVDELYAEITGHHHHHGGAAGGAASVAAAGGVRTPQSSISSMADEDELQYQALVRQHNEGLAPFLEEPHMGEPSFAIDQQAWGPMEVVGEQSQAQNAVPSAADGSVGSPQLAGSGQLSQLEAEQQALQRLQPEQSDLEPLPEPPELVETDHMHQGSTKDAGCWSASEEEYEDGAEGGDDVQRNGERGSGVDVPAMAEEVADETGALQQQALTALDEQVEAESFLQPDVQPTKPTDDLVARQSSRKGADVLRVSDQGYHASANIDALQTGSDAVSKAVSGVLDYDLDDGSYIDFAVDAMIASLEQPYSAQLRDQPFTICGWEIDRQLDGLLDSLALNDYGFNGIQDTAQGSERHSRPSTSQVHLQLLLSGEDLRVSVLPWTSQPTPPIQPTQPLPVARQLSFPVESAAQPLDKLNELQSRPASAASGVLGRLGSSSGAGAAGDKQLLQLPSRPPTRQIHLHLSQLDGVLTCSLLPAGAVASAATNMTVAQPPSRSVSIDRVLRTQQSAQQSLVLSRIVSTSSRAGLPVVPSRSCSSINRQSQAGTASRPGTSQVRLCLDLKGDQVAASLVPARAVHGMHGTTAQPNPVQAGSRPGTAQVSLVLHLTDDHVTANVVPKDNQADAQAVAVSRPGTAHVELILSIADDVLQAQLHACGGQQVGVAVDIPREMLRQASHASSWHTSVLGTEEQPVGTSFDHSASSGNLKNRSFARNSSGNRCSMTGAGEAGSARLQLILDFSGGEGGLRAQLVPQRSINIQGQGSSNGRAGVGGSSANGRGLRPSISQAPLPTLEEETETSTPLATARPAADAQQSESTDELLRDANSPLHKVSSTVESHGGAIGDQPAETDMAIQGRGDVDEENDIAQQPVAWVNLKLEFDETGAIHAVLAPTSPEEENDAQGGEEGLLAEVEADTAGASADDGIASVAGSRPATSQMHVELHMEGEELRLHMVPHRQFQEHADAHVFE